MRTTRIVLMILVAVLLIGTLTWGYLMRQGYDDPKTDCPPEVSVCL